jgi:hypothetical protein
LVEFPDVVKQRYGVSRVFVNVDVDDAGAGTAVDLPETAGPEFGGGEGAEAAVAALYRASAVSLIRLAYVMLDDLPGAEDVVQEAFCGLYRRWDRLKDPDSALGRQYQHIAVNACFRAFPCAPLPSRAHRDNAVRRAVCPGHRVRRAEPAPALLNAPGNKGT